MVKHPWVVVLFACALLAAPARAGEKIVDRALAWLAAHQDKDGKWDCDDFMKHDPKVEKTTGAGDSRYDVGVTALSLLALIGAGNSDEGSQKENPYATNVKQGFHYLIAQQDVEGCFGPRTTERFVYNHAIATLALCEACRFFKRPEYVKPARAAIRFLEGARNPQLAWRYLPHGGDNDTSITCWCILALESAKGAGLQTDPKAFAGALHLTEHSTDDDGSVGYNMPGPSVRPKSAGLGYELDFKTPADTCGGILIRTACGQKCFGNKAIEAGLRIILANVPRWDAKSKQINMVYWTLGAWALDRCGGWQKWKSALRKLSRNQSEDGSWPPAGVWGNCGGRVYSTAMMTLTFEAAHASSFGAVSPYRPPGSK